jgi:hypothetical protein
MKENYLEAHLKGNRNLTGGLEVQKIMSFWEAYL